MKKTLIVLMLLALLLVPGCRWGNDVDIDIDFAEQVEKAIEQYNNDLDTK